MGFISLVFLVLVSFGDTYQLVNYDSKKDTGDFGQLQSLVARGEISRPEDFLTQWKMLRPEFFSNYVLGYRSRSLQQSSPMYPRALTFNKNADLVISFNGNPEHRGYQNLEVMRFNHDQKAFEFYEMSFDSGKATLSEANPKKCLACHQSVSRTGVDPRPNWEPYNTWPGFYGSLDDSTELFKSSFKREPGFDPVLDQILLTEIEAETQWMINFRSEIQPNHVRYSLLTQDTTDQYGSRETTLNGDLTNRLAVLNFKRVARLMRSQPKAVYDFSKWTLWAHAKCGMTLYMSEDVYEWLYAQVPNKDNARRLARAAVAPTYSCRRHFEGVKVECPPPPDYKNTDSTDVINVLFESVGVSTEDWSMDFKTDGGRLAAFERFGVTNDPRPPWIDAIKNEFGKDPELAAADCDTAKAESLKRFSSLADVQEHVRALQAQNPKPPERPLISRCISCHSSERASRDDTPVIPFEDPALLKMALQKNGYKRGNLLGEIRYRIGPHALESEQMPKGAVPTTAQKAELLRYLESL